MAGCKSWTLAMVCPCLPHNRAISSCPGIFIFGEGGMRGWGGTTRLSFGMGKCPAGANGAAGDAKLLQFIGNTTAVL